MNQAAAALNITPTSPLAHLKPMSNIKVVKTVSFVEISQISNRMLVTSFSFCNAKSACGVVS